MSAHEELLRRVNAGDISTQEAAILLASPSGMTLRDYFAAAALTGMVANPSVARWGGDDNTAPHHHDVVATAYNIADAMLAERAK